MLDGIRRDANLDPQAGLREVKQLVELLGRGAERFRVRAVAARSRGGWTNLLCVVDACDRAKVVTETKRYSHILFARTQLDRQQLFAFLERTMQGKVVLPDGEVSFPSPRKYWSRIYRPSRSGLSPQPGTLFTIEPSERTPQFDLSLHDPLPCYDQPYWPQARTAVAEWTGLQSLRRSESSHDLGAVMLFLPERRAWFDSFERGGKILRIRVGGARTRTSKLIVRGAFLHGEWWRGEGTPSVFGVRVRAGKAEVQIPDRWEALQAYLIGPEDEVFDYHSQGLHGSAGHAPVPASEEEAGLDAMAGTLEPIQKPATSADL